MVRRHSKEFYGRGIASQEGKDFGNKSTKEESARIVNTLKT